MWSAAALAIWAALSASRNVAIPGRRSFILMQSAIALWSATAGVELLSSSMTSYLWISRVQYIGIVSLPVFWFRFAGTYAHRLNPRNRSLDALWLVPFVTVMAAFTNDSHHLLWTDIVMPGPGDVLPTYVRGPIFWLNWIHAYVLIAIGTVWLALTLRHYSARYRIQLWLLILGVLAPWVGNLLYILGLVPLPGLDMTPLAFSVSGACFVASVFAARR
ncbi:MAG: hypothetical protein KAY59_05875 [Acidobacteria bacterium]|nr:hypothetical protein [Acidobacteriota bacterium]